MAPLSKLRKSTRTASPAAQRSAFESFVGVAEPKLRRAFAGIRDHHVAKDAVGAALAWAWENWDLLQGMDNPVGYLFRVGQSATRSPKDFTAVLLTPAEIGLPDIEPALIPALIALPERQRVVIWLVHGCEWTHREVAESLEISPSTVATHVDRALVTLRNTLSVPSTSQSDTELPSARGGHHDS